MHATLRHAPPHAVTPAIAAAFCFHSALTDSLPRLRRYGLMLTRSRAAMEDLVQDSVVRALAAERGFEPGSNFNAWIHRILRNEFISGIRRNRLFGAYDPLAVEKIAIGPAQEDRLVMRELADAIARLPDTQREALLLSTVSGLSHDEVAATMGCEVGTVKSRLGRARAQLQRDLTGMALGDTPDAPRLPPIKRRGRALPDGDTAAMSCAA